MKKLLLAATGLTLALSFAPSHAEPGNGCQAAGGAADVGITCTYTAKGPGHWFAATPNHYTIVVQRVVDGETVTIALVERDTLQPPQQGALATQADDVVTVTMGPDDAEVVAGAIGIVAAGEIQ